MSGLATSTFCVSARRECRGGSSTLLQLQGKNVGIGPARSHGYLPQTYNVAMSVPPTTPYGTICAGMHPQRSFPPLVSQAGMACETIPPSVDHGIELPVIDLKDLDHLLPATNVFGYSNVGAAAIPSQNDEIPAIQPSNQNPVTSTAALSTVSNTLNNQGPENFAQQLNMHHLSSPTTLPAPLNPLPPNTPPTFGTPVASPAVLQPTQFQTASPLTNCFHGKRVRSPPVVIPNPGNSRWVK